MSDKEKRAALDKLYIEAESLLLPYITFGRPVFGTGSVSTGIVLVGEAPGRFEAESGTPFVGAAGKDLDLYLKDAGLDRNELFITNAVKFRPTAPGKKPGGFVNRAPRKNEIALCRDILSRELVILRPVIVATLGNTALRSVSGDDRLSIGSERAKPRQVSIGDHAFTLFPMYHPAGAIYDRSLKETLALDMKAFASLANKLSK